MDAVRLDDMKKIMSILEKAPFLAQERGVFGRTALIMAASVDSPPDCVRALIPFSDANAIDNTGRTALMHAAGGGYAERVQMLLEVSDAKVADGGGQTALMMACATRSTACVKALLPRSNANAVDEMGRFALFHAFGVGAAPEPVEIVRLLAPATSPRLIKSRLEIQRQTVLMLAAIEGAAECVKLLLPKSRPDEQDEEGRTALTLALQSGWPGAPDAIRALLAVSDPNKEKTSGENALFTAVGRGDAEFVRFLFPLCEKKGNVIGTTALDVARVMEKPGVIDVFSSLIEPDELADLVKTHGAENMPQAAARLEAMELQAEIKKEPKAPVLGAPGFGSALALADGGLPPRKTRGRL